MTPTPNDSRLTVFLRATLARLRAGSRDIRTHPRTVVAVALVLALGYFAWPTPYRYGIYRESNRMTSWSTTVRISRFTGRSDILTRVGWQPMQSPPPPLRRYRADNPFAPAP
mgnify:FL=1